MREEVRLTRTKDEDILFLIKILNKELRSCFDKKLEECGLTGVQGRCLFYIYIHHVRNVECHQNNIEKEFELSKSTVSGLIDRLENKELIARVVDKKYTKLLPTEKGIAVIDNIHQGSNQTIEKLFKGFNENERIEIIKTMNRLITNLKEDDETCGIE